MQFSRVVFSSLIVLILPLAVRLSAKEVVKMGAGSGLPFSPAVKAGNFVYVSGALATNEKGQVVPGTIQEQTKQVLNHLGTVLKASGSRLEHAASVNGYLKTTGG